MSNNGSRKSYPVTSRGIALDILTRVDQDGSYSNLLLNQVLQKHALERSDAALVTEIVYGTIQRLNTIDFFLERFVRQGLNKLQPWVKSLLRLSFYQLYYLERIPPHAIVNEAVNIAKRKGHAGISGMVNAVLRNIVRQKEELTLPKDLTNVKRISLLHSHPEWLVSRWVKRYGEANAERMCSANNMPPQASLRANTLRHTREQLIAQLRQEGFEAAESSLSPVGITVRGGGNMASTRWYAEGEMTIQDESSMLVAEIVAPLPGMRVLDCCAAPGGKTTHLAEKMKDQGYILAVDLHEHKEKLIRDQAERLGLRCVHTMASDVRTLTDRLPGQSERFDCLLLDAPCTGFGVIRRKPDLKWSKTERDITEISKLQLDILSRVQSLLKPGGVLVYSTCTTEEEENENVIAAFMRKFPEFSLDDQSFPQLPEQINLSMQERGMVQILPDQFDSDGFFIARMRKRG